MSEFGLEQIPALAGDHGDYLGYEDDDDTDEMAGYFDDEIDDDELDIEFANGADEFGDEVGRRRPRRWRRRPMRRRGRPLRRAPAPRRAPRRQKKVIKVKDGQIILSATSSSAGVVTDTLSSPYDFWPTEITTDGSTSGGFLSQLTVGDVNFIGPHPADRSLPVSAYQSASNKSLSLRGHMIRSGQNIQIAGTIANGGDKLMIVIHGKKRVGSCS